MSKRVANKRGGPGVGARSRRTWATHTSRLAHVGGPGNPVVFGNTPTARVMDRRGVQVKKPPLITRAITHIKRFFRGG